MACGISRTMRTSTVSRRCDARSATASRTGSGPPRSSGAEPGFGWYGEYVATGIPHSGQAPRSWTLHADHAILVILTPLSTQNCATQYIWFWLSHFTSRSGAARAEDAAAAGT